MNTLTHWRVMLMISMWALLHLPTYALNVTPDNEGTFEHPEITRFPGFHIDGSKRNDFAEHCFPRGNSDSCDSPATGEVKAGRYWFVDYVLNEGARSPSPIELLRNYEVALRKLGGSLVSRYPAGGPPQTAVFRVPAAGTERWVQLTINHSGDRYQLNLIEVSGLTQKIELTANEMADAIKKRGSVALHGIEFDTGKATIRASSHGLLEEVTNLMLSDRTLKLVVEGHTDNVGAKSANLDLSKRRAEAVVAYLVGAKVNPSRLKAVGKADSAPISDNATEAGRAKNRRVELVKF